MPAIMSGAASHRPRDPAERWEIDCGEPGASSSPRGIYDIFPRTPRRAEDLPGGALEALNKGCSLEGLDQLFVIPRAVRSTGHGDQRVISPLCVLGIGTRAVGLWTEEPEPGM